MSGIQAFFPPSISPCTKYNVDITQGTNGFSVVLRGRFVVPPISPKCAVVYCGLLCTVSCADPLLEADSPISPLLTTNWLHHPRPSLAIDRHTNKRLPYFLVEKLKMIKDSDYANSYKVCGWRASRTEEEERVTSRVGPLVLNNVDNGVTWNNLKLLAR